MVCHGEIPPVSIIPLLGLCEILILTCSIFILTSMTGGRIKRIQPYIGNETFCMTYGDGVCDVDISEIIKFHRSHGKLATLTSVLLDQSKGVLNIGGDNAVQSFREKSKEDSAPINAGYMVLEPEVFDYLDGDECIFEQAPLQKLAAEGQLMCYQHRGFWQCMDTMREKIQLENLWQHGKAPWKVWGDCPKIQQDFTLLGDL